MTAKKLVVAVWFEYSHLKNISDMDRNKIESINVEYKIELIYFIALF